MMLMIPRVCFSIALLISVIFGPFWLSVILAILGMMYFSFYVEAAVIFLVLDLLYGAREARFHGAVFISFIFSVALFILIELFKKKLKFYPK